MSSYIIAGSSDNSDTAYCEEVAKKIKAKYSNIDFRIIIKHPSEWDSHLQEVCRIYGFRNKSNPIIYTFDGKIIGDKQAFLRTTSKYFGISEKDMQIGPISVDINKKQADEQLRKKLKLKRQEKTLLESIDLKIEEKLKEKVFVHKLHVYDKTIENCLVLYKRKVDGLCNQMEFTVEKQVESKKEQIQPDEDLDLMAMSFRDQIHVIEEPQPHTGAAKDKEAFVTHQEEAAANELRRSKTNGSVRLHESSVSHENQSKHSSNINRQNRQNNNKTQVQEEFFEQSRYYELFNIENYIVSDLGDEFYLVLNSKPVILGQLQIVKIAPTEQGLFQMDYSKHPRQQKGHLYKQPQPPTQQMIEEITTKQIVDMEKPPDSQMEIKKEDEDQASIDNEIKQEKKEEGKEQLKLPVSSRNQGDIFNNLLVQEQFEVELETRINARVLNFLKPLSILEIKKIYEVLPQTQALATIHYSQTNPNPKIVIHLRKYIYEAIQHSKNKSIKLPIEANIMEFINDLEIIKDGLGFIRNLGYMHLVSKKPVGIEQIPELIKKMLTLLLQLQNSLNKFIGYNLILAPEYIMAVPLVDCYQNYNNQNLYVDGLAYIGVVHIAQTNSPFTIKKPQELKSFAYLTKCAGTVDLAEKLK